KRGIKLVPSSLTMTPDLVFDGYGAVGDVKYKTVTGDWPRGDLYQAVAFATAFKVGAACVISFRTSPAKGPPDLQTGDVRLVSRSWICGEDTPPSVAAELLAAEIDSWLSGQTRTSRTVPKEQLSALPQLEIDYEDTT